MTKYYAIREGRAWPIVQIDYTAFQKLAPFDYTNGGGTGVWAVPVYYCVSPGGDLMFYPLPSDDGVEIVTDIRGMRK